MISTKAHSEPKKLELKIDNINIEFVTFFNFLGTLNPTPSKLLCNILGISMQLQTSKESNPDCNDKLL